MPVEFGDALKETAAVCDSGFETEDGWTFEVENAERGEIVLNQIVDGSHGVNAALCWPGDWLGSSFWSC